ncbi:DEAD (Asp-Glu-Ala-Asp) box polypeptide 23, partial [Clydaea vesicula]
MSSRTKDDNYRDSRRRERSPNDRRRDERSRSRSRDSKYIALRYDRDRRDRDRDRRDYDDREYTRRDKNYDEKRSNDKEIDEKRKAADLWKQEREKRLKENTLNLTESVSKVESEANSTVNEIKPKREPISVEDLLKKRNMEKVEKEKVVFLSKEQRAKLALEKREAQVEELRRKQEESIKLNKEFLKNAAIEAAKINSSRYGSSRERNEQRRIEAEKKKKREEDGELSESELQTIRDRYIGAEKKKRKIRKMNEKKFVFDWAADEDTSTKTNLNKHELNLLGKGTIAGLDPMEQYKKRSGFYAKVQKERSLMQIEEEKKSKEEGETVSKNAVVEIDFNKSFERGNVFDERHWSEKKLSEMKERDWRIFKEDYNISCKGGKIPHPIRSWEESTISGTLLHVIEKVGYTKPSPIQRQAIPIGLQNRDIIGIAETGSGKTASFLIPMLEFILKLPPLTDKNSPYALILAPTRELALQIEQETLNFLPLGVSIIGGHSVIEQSMSMNEGVHIIIGTPGRMKDLLENHLIVLHQCTYVVMDEADKMIDMGFELDVNYILDAIPLSNIKPDDDAAEDPIALREKLGLKTIFRQTVMFSATMPTLVEKLAKKYMRRPAVVTIGTAGQAVDKIEQRVEMMGEDRKKQRLIEILNSGEFKPPMIVFVNQKKGCDSLSKAMNNLGFNTTILHGSKSQEQRESSLRGLKDGTKDVLVATDVASRGIDVKKVSVVINYDMAKDIESYTHRIGRTARAGESGVAITFISPQDEGVYFDLRHLLLKSGSKIPP